ncbi:MAG: hypothetical protein FWH03_01225 [Firmicutes bacterium]|nr:hypothetical protein [Bacillota bacterium]
MTVHDCVKFAAESLGLDAVAQVLTEKTPLSGLNASDEREYKLLLSCARAVLLEIAAEFVPLTRTANVAARNGKIPYADISKDLVEIISVKKAGRAVLFSSDYDGAHVFSDGIFEVTYAFLPNTENPDAALAYANGKVNARNAGYGVAAEYCIRTGQTDDAALWDKRYKDAMVAAAVRRRESCVARRRWL